METRSLSCQIFLVSGISPSLLRLYDCYPWWLQKLTHFLTSGLAPSNVSDPANINLTMSHCHLKIPALTPHYLKDEAPASWHAVTSYLWLGSASFCSAFTYQSLPGSLRFCHKEELAVALSSLVFFASKPLFIMSSLNCPSIPSPWPGQHLLSFKA